ncbi:MAG: hypothetical protein IKY59_05605 [Oscillospiraceae bacterium]|nr:hypothetical protein [Oscillospiraceae bacterium]
MQKRITALFLILSVLIGLLAGCGVTEPTTSVSLQNPTTGTTKPQPTTQETEPTKPETKPTDPVTQPTEPATQPTEPATQPTEPETKPTEPKPTETKPTNGGSSSGASREPVLDAPTDQVVDASFFDDAAFIGDSVSLKLSYYAADSGELGNAKFLVRGSYGVINAVTDKLLMTYQGEKMKIEDAVAATGAKKLFIMLGLNDFSAYGIDKTIQYWGKLLTRIRSTCPDIDIYIQSMTPIWTGGEIGGLTNKNADKYNARLKEFAEQNGCKYIDIASYMKDETNGLATKFCSDEYVHLSTAGAKRWVAVLKAYTEYNQ